jgi:NAD(P)-dependent dehydrogenase (short-subunit alcohol dehydrogenase family)
MKHALIVGASGGIGSALRARLEADGVAVTALSRAADGLDVTDEASVASALAAIERPADLVFVATGALEIDGRGPEKALDALEPAALIAQIRLNALGPMLVLKHARRLMPREGRSVFAALSARVGSIGDNGKGGWYSYRASKAALNQLLHTAAIELRRTHREAVCVALHPGTVRTGLTAKYAGRHPTVAAEAAAADLLAVLAELGPEASGGFFDWQGKRVAW